jgi:hypothetical protein
MMPPMSTLLRARTSQTPIAPRCRWTPLALACCFLGLSLAGCAAEIPVPKNSKAPPEITGELHEKMLLQIGTMGKFRRVAQDITAANQQTLVIQATVTKWDTGNAFLRWMGSVAELIGGIYESYAKEKVGMVSGTVGDGFLLVDMEFVDKNAKQPIGKLSIKALADSPDSYHAAVERAVDALLAYMKTRY